MKRDIKGSTKLLIFVMTISIVMLFGSSNVWAKKDGNLAIKLQGSWMLVSMYNEIDGKKIDLFGINPRGSMILTPNGRFSIIIMKANLPKFASNNRLKGTNADYQAVVQGSIAYFGSYKVLNEKENIVGLHIEGCTFPNWGGGDQTRVMSIIGDEMKFTGFASTVGGVNHLVWKRVK